MKKLMLAVAVLVGSACGTSSVTDPSATTPTYAAPSAPGRPMMCLPVEGLPTADKPSPKPDPVTGECPTGWYRP